jgi:hypothetical protein
MKITLNLSAAASARDRYALAWAIPATLLGLAALVLLSRASLDEYRDYRGIQQQVVQIQSRANDLRSQEAAIRKKLEDPAYQKLLHKAQFVNKLIADRKFTLTEVTARLAGLLPEDARLSNLELTSPKKPGGDYSLRMGITAKGEDAIDTFLNDLEDTPDFKDVAILNQGFKEESSQDKQMILVCTARYLPGAEAEAEAAAPSYEPEAGNAKPEAGSQAGGDKNSKVGRKTQEPGAGSQKLEKGAGH